MSWAHTAFTISKFSLAGFGVNSMSKVSMACWLSHATVMDPCVRLKWDARALTRTRIAYIPAISHRWESPSLIGPGTSLTPTILPLRVLPSTANADVPYPSLRDPSLTATAVWDKMASAMSEPELL